MTGSGPPLHPLPLAPQAAEEAPSATPPATPPQPPTHLVEGLEEAGPLLLGDADPAVGHLDDDVACALVRLHTHRHTTLEGCMGVGGGEDGGAVV